MEIIMITVGERTFKTTKETLKQAGYFNTIFSEQFKNDLKKENDVDTLFIDRDGDMFEIVLNYLRTGLYDGVNENNYKKWNNEIDYYGLEVKKLKIVYCYCHMYDGGYVDINCDDKKYCKDSSHLSNIYKFLFKNDFKLSKNEMFMKQEKNSVCYKLEEIIEEIIEEKHKLNEK